jgi:phosphonatase-like hydrolase
MHIELVVFDIGGTTVAEDHAVRFHLRETLRAADVSVTEHDVDGVMGFGKLDAIRRLLHGSRAGDESSALGSSRLVDTLHAAFEERMVAHYRHHPGVREVQGASHAFRRLQQMGIRVALDTGLTRAVADVVIDRMGWSARGLIDASVASDEVRCGRPAPDMISRAMELTGIHDASRVVKVGDTPADLYEGFAAGCALVVAVTSGERSDAELRLHPCTHVVPTVALVPELIRRVDANPPLPVALAWSATTP